MSYIFKLQHRDKVKSEAVGKFEAKFSNKIDDATVDASTIPKFVKISDEPFSGCFKTSMCTGDGIIVVHTSKITAIPEDNVVSYEKINSWQFWKYKLANDFKEKMALLGFAVAVIGLAIDLVLGIGKSNTSYTWIVEHDEELTWISFGMKLAGLLLIYIKGIREWK